MTPPIEKGEGYSTTSQGIKRKMAEGLGLDPDSPSTNYADVEAAWEKIDAKAWVENWNEERPEDDPYRLPEGATHDDIWEFYKPSVDNTDI